MAMDLHHLPFKVGQQAESKSFLVGFRSAWFRCKIKNISYRRGQIGYSLEFFDFPDEKVSWTKLYQKPPEEQTGSHGESKMELMVRPFFPPFYRESQLPDSYPVSDVIAIVDDDWKVGDLIDWWYDGCFWFGRVTQLLGNDKVKIELPEPPIGEGKSYIALGKDLRPSLDWSPEHGWTVPISREYGNCQYCARLVQPLKQETNDRTINLKSDGTREGTLTQDEKLDPHQTPSCLHESSCSHDEVKVASGIPTKISSRLDRYSSLDSHEKHTGGRKYMTSVRRSNTIDSSIMELEELANKIRWLKGILQFGFHQSNAMKPLWKFLENRGSQKER